jgi:hypothetical protein
MEDKELTELLFAQEFKRIISGHNNMADWHRPTNIGKVSIENASDIFQLGLHFKVIIDAIHDDPFLMSEWERFTIALKMREEPK